MKQLQSLLPVDAPVLFNEIDGCLVLQVGHARLTLQHGGDITISNKHAAINLSAFGEVSVQANANVAIQSERDIHLNSE